MDFWIYIWEPRYDWLRQYWIHYQIISDYQWQNIGSRRTKFLDLGMGMDVYEPNAVCGQISPTECPQIQWLVLEVTEFEDTPRMKYEYEQDSLT